MCFNIYTSCKYPDTCNTTYDKTALLRLGQITPDDVGKTPPADESHKDDVYILIRALCYMPLSLQL